jgi:catechol 2,3-dioxygenase-like lactoylglutathione lyase family enzyme
MALHFRYSAFFVSDVPATVAFYDKAFGFRLRYMHPSSGDA